MSNTEFSAPVCNELPIAPSRPRPLPVIATAPAPTPGLRHSNEVEGFKYKRWLAFFYVAKLLLAIPLFPILPFLMAHDAGDWSLARDYFGTLGYVIRTFMVHLRFGSFKRALKYNVLMTAEDVEQRLALRKGACTRCAKCCKQYDCIFLGQNDETKDYYCKVYGTTYWFYGTCGRYPLDQEDIDDHSCPGFSFDEAPQT